LVYQHIKRKNQPSLKI